MLIGSLLFFQIIGVFELVNPQSVKKGVQGIALSTFQGTKIDTLQVEILGKIPRSPSTQEIIVAKLKGKAVDEAGLIAGMSGSPVYIEGKLLGAVAFGWTFSKEPICGITPFSEMKKMTVKESAGPSMLTPIKPVLNVAGFSSSSIPLLDSLPFDFALSQTALGGKTDKISELVPGGVCGITLVSGDGNLSALGTITEVVGDTVYAFGHSAYAVGSSTLPLCGGNVFSYLPSYYRSFKFAIPGDIIGKVVFDGNAGIKAVIGDSPPMVDCRIKIEDFRRKYRVTAEESIFPSLPPFLLFSAWVESKGLYKSSTIEGEVGLFTGEGKIFIPIVVSGTEVQRSLYKGLREILLGVQRNRFEDVSIDSISVSLSSEPEIRRYSVKNLIVKKKKFELGDTIAINVVLDRYRRPDTTLIFDFVPSMDPGNLLLRVSGKDSYLNYELGRAPFNFEFDSFKEWREFLNTAPAPNQLVFSVYKKAPSLSTDAGEIKNLPPSLKLIMGGEKKKVYSDLYPIREVRIQLDGPLTGESFESVEIGR